MVCQRKVFTTAVKYKEFFFVFLVTVYRQSKANGGEIFIAEMCMKVVYVWIEEESIYLVL